MFLCQVFLLTPCSSSSVSPAPFFSFHLTPRHAPQVFTTPKCWSQQIAHTLIKQIYLFTYLEKAVLRSISSRTQERNTGKAHDYVLGRLLMRPHERELRLLNEELLRHPSRQGITDTHYLWGLSPASPLLVANPSFVWLEGIEPFR